MKFWSALILTFAIFGTTAQAFQGTLQMADDGSVVVKPLTAKCTPDMGDQVNPPSSCNPAGKSCPEDYTRAKKYCWGGWKKGFYFCGMACHLKQYCKWGPHGDYRCGNPGGGHHGSNRGRG